MTETTSGTLPDSIIPELRSAFNLLRQGKADEAIAICSSSLCMACVQSHSAPGYILGKAYFMRGDSKGDLFAATWFLEQSLRLGEDCDEVYAMLAVLYFRRRNYQKCADACTHFISENVTVSSAWLLYGVTALLASALDDSLAAFQKAAVLNSDSWLPYAGLACVYHALKRPGDLQRVLTCLAERHDGTVPPALVVALEKDSLSQSELYELLLHSGALEFYPGPDLPPEPAAIAMPRALSAEFGTVHTPKDFNWIVQNIPCQASCPALTDVPGYINAIARDEYQSAYYTNMLCNVFPAVLGRVCSRPCEAACRHGFTGNGDPVAICYLKRAADDAGRMPAGFIPQKLFPPSGKSIAIAGSGPAGLAAARDLALYGHTVTVFEAYHEPGGMLNQGIPKFRLPRECITSEIDQIRALGVTIRCNTTIGRDCSLQSLRDQFDAVILAFGTLHPNIPELPGCSLDGIAHGLRFMEEVNRTDHGSVGNNVLVIGGGFTAMDCSRSAFRLGAEQVSIYYRRSENEMPVPHEEIVEARHEGIALVELMSPVEYIGDNGRVTAVKFIKNSLGEPDASGRRRPVPIPGTETVVPADTVLLATGQYPDYSALSAYTGDQLFSDGWLRVDPETHMTPLPGLFAAGDFVSGASTIIDAVGSARRTALKVDTWLMDRQRRKSVVKIEPSDATGRIREYDDIPLQAMPMLAVHRRENLRAEVESGFHAAESSEEARRCYLCHFKFEIDMRLCIYCDWCIRAKPAHLACIKKVAAFQTDEHGIIRGVTEAVHSGDTRAIWIDSHECIRCGQCLRACPVDAITLKKVCLSDDLCDAGEGPAPFLQLQQ